MTGKNTDTQKTSTSDQVKDNGWLFVIVFLGIGLSIIGVVLWQEMLIAVGAAFIIAGGVGVYMMLATRQVAKNLHLRFNEQNNILGKLEENSGKQTDILSKMDGSLNEIASSQKEIASSQKDIASSQKDIASSQKEIASSQKEIASSQKEIASSQKETSSSLKDMTDILKRIEDKL